MNIVLIGYRCCGKTSTGRLIAKKLGRQFIDTDEKIVEKSGCSIDEIVASRGWQHFREIEKDVVEKISTGENLVIATGGGVVTDEENIRNLRGNGFIVWLYADIDTIKKRLDEDLKSSSSRPSLTGDNSSDEITKVLEQRKPFYKNASDMAVNTTYLDINNTAKIIIERIKNL